MRIAPFHRLRLVKAVIETAGLRFKTSFRAPFNDVFNDSRFRFKHLYLFDFLLLLFLFVWILITHEITPLLNVKFKHC